MSRRLVPPIAVSIGALAIALVSMGAHAAGAATVLSKQITIDIRSETLVRETTRLRVRLDSASDLDSWSYYAVPLDANRTLRSFEASSVATDGKRRKAGRARQDRIEYSGSATASSESFHVVDFPGLEPGAIVEIAYVVEVEPYFPSSQMALLGSDPILELSVEITGGARWRLDGPRDGLEAEDRPDGVIVRGRDLDPADSAELAARGAASEPVLRWAWSADTDWNEVGLWYGSLLANLPEESPAVGKLARELTRDAATPRQRLEALVQYMRRKVRYVAVEIGIGGYRPSPPAEVLERKWGDCKDKGLLLVSLLREVGFEAYPALILLDRERRIEPAFPSPAQFNHLIVAVSASAVPLEEGDPVAGGFLFVDPTQTRGTVGWLHPGVQDQDALIVTPSGGTLVRTPIAAGSEHTELAAELEVHPEGTAVGEVELVVRGTYGAYLLDRIEGESAAAAGEDLMAVLQALLPGARLERLSWREVSGAVPAVRASASVEIPAFAQPSGAGASLRVPALRSMPEPRFLTEMGVPVAYPARSRSSRWRLGLPPGWCPPSPRETGASNDVGSFVQSLGAEGERVLTVERSGRVGARWFEGDALDALRELAVVEHRALKRRLRLGCE